MKKVLFYTDTPNLGGAEKHMLLLAKYLSRMEVEVSLAYGRYSKITKLHDEFQKYCKNIFVLKNIHKHDPRHYYQLKKVLKGSHSDLVHIHLWNPGSARYAFFAASAVGVPIVATEHDPFALEGMKKMIKRACLDKTARTITVSRDNFGLLDQYYAVPEKRLELVHNGIEIDTFLDNQDRAELPVETGDQVITCIAELHRRKGHKYLIKAFQRLYAHMPKLRLILVGIGPEERLLKEKYGKVPNVHFLGWRKDIPQILRASDIFVLPSLREAFGLVLLEAMASGVACVATNNGGTTDIIQDGVTGYLIPPSNSDAIFEKVSLILKNPDQKKDIQDAALQRVKEEFTAQKMAEKTLKVYEKVW